MNVTASQPAKFKKWMQLSCITALMIIFSGLLVVTLTLQGVATTPDSLSYMYAAQKIAHGEGVVIPELRLENESFETPMVTWPPLYPVMLSLIISDKNPEKSLRLSNFLCLVMLGLFFIYGAAHFKNETLSLLGVFLLLLQTPIMTVYTYAWSETLFIPLIFGCYIFAYKYFLGRKNALIVAILLFLAACYSRYVGIIFLFPFLVTVSANKSVFKKKLYFSVGVLLVIVTCLSPLYIRNILLSGTVSGADRLPSNNTLIDNVIATGDLIGLHLFNVAFWGVPTIIFLLLLLWLYFCIKKSKTTEYQVDITRPMLTFLWICFYFAAIAVLRSWKAFDEIDTRLISPTIPFIIFLLFDLINYTLIKKIFISASLIFLMWGALLFFMGVNSYKNALANWRNYNSPLFVSTARQTYNNFTGNSIYPVVVDIYQKAKEITQTESPVIVFEGSCCGIFLKHAITDAKVKWLPPTLDAWHIEQINKLGVGVVMVVTDEGLDEFKRYYKSDFTKLDVVPVSKNQHAWFIKMPLFVINQSQ